MREKGKTQVFFRDCYCAKMWIYGHRYNIKGRRANVGIKRLQLCICIAKKKRKEFKICTWMPLSATTRTKGYETPSKSLISSLSIGG